MATENQNLAASSYQKEFRELLQAVFSANSYFGDFFAGGIEALDGVQHNATAFSVKTSDIPVVVGSEYDKDPDVAFGSGTGASTRFGERTEIIYTDTDVPYTWEWVFHEGIDRHTVNNSMESAIADRLELQAQAKTRAFNRHHRDFIAASAGKTLDMADYADVLELFDALSEYFVDIEAVGTKVAKVRASLYNAIINHELATSLKHSGADIDANSVLMFKGFQIEQVQNSMLTVTDGPGAGDYDAFAYIAGVGKAFTGINTARTIEAHDFDGFALQGAGKAGEFILDDNRPAVVAVKAAT